MSMNFLDETDDWLEYQTVRDEINRLDREHLELLKELEEAVSDCRSDSADEGLRIKVDRLRMKLKEIEDKLDASLSMYR
jgi:hypothetical protein